MAQKGRRSSPHNTSWDGDYPESQGTRLCCRREETFLPPASWEVTRHPAPRQVTDCLRRDGSRPGTAKAQSGKAEIRGLEYVLLKSLRGLLSSKGDASSFLEKQWAFGSSSVHNISFWV